MSCQIYFRRLHSGGLSRRNANTSHGTSTILYHQIPSGKKWGYMPGLAVVTTYKSPPGIIIYNGLTKVFTKHLTVDDDYTHQFYT